MPTAAVTGAPAVAVITPTRNRARLLQETLDSVAAQSFADWEHIVVDDGSDDGTAQIMAARTAADPRFSYIVRQGPTSGANACRNIGIKAAARRCSCCWTRTTCSNRAAWSGVSA